MLDRRTISVVLLLALLSSRARADEPTARKSSADRHDWAVGATVGLPQLIALSVEREVDSHLRVQANVGTAAAISSLNGRLIAVADELVLQPYAFLGGGFAAALGAPDAESVPYVWYGLGLRLGMGRAILFGEAGKVTLHDAHGDGPAIALPALAMGVLVKY